MALFLKNPMPLVLGIDVGTTTITALALDAANGAVLAVCTAPNAAETTAPADKIRGNSEWDVRSMARTACECLRQVAERLGERRQEVVGIGITGQQHGIVVVDRALAPLTPFINWQDRRAEAIDPATGKTYVQRAAERMGPDAPSRTGCRLAAGYAAVTLYWMKEKGVLPPNGTACFVMDYLGAFLTGQPPVTDPTCAASSGVLNLPAGDWDSDLLEALELPPSLFPTVRPSGERLGELTTESAQATGLPLGVPVFVGIGDNQASFLGSVADRADSVLVNVGTGGQVAAFVDHFVYDPALETRPFPGGGFLLVCAGLSGGRVYALLERFFRQVGTDLLGQTASSALYPIMNRLAAQVPAGADGLRCEPFFSGTRADPNLRASWTGMSAENFTPGHLTRALLEGMARAFRRGYESVRRHGSGPRHRLIGAGNGMRENPLLANLVAREFDLPLFHPLHREEAAFGAALVAAVGSGACPDWAAAGRLIRYVPVE
jgi:sugar (pentulose or hexulose) kinase